MTPTRPPPQAPDNPECSGSTPAARKPKLRPPACFREVTSEGSGEIFAGSEAFRRATAAPPSAPAGLAPLTNSH